MEKILDYFKSIWETILNYVPNIIFALIVLFIGMKIISFISKVARKQFEKSKMEKSLYKFLLNLVSWTLKLLLMVSVAQMIGIATTSFVALIGTAGLAIGLALQGALANFAGGVMLMIFKPYKIGDLILVKGKLGHVEEIQIFTSLLITLDNKRVIIPNGSISNAEIENYSALGKIRVDLEVGIAYEADIKKAKKTMIDVMEKHPKVMKNPAPFVGVLNLADSAVVLAVRPFCNPEIYWDVYFEILEECKLALNAQNVTIPFPQMDVHLKK